VPLAKNAHGVIGFTSHYRLRLSKSKPPASLAAPPGAVLLVVLAPRLVRDGGYISSSRGEAIPAYTGLRLRHGTLVNHFTCLPLKSLTFLTCGFSAGGCVIARMSRRVLP
jgi:hypothetical protein